MLRARAQQGGRDQRVRLAAAAVVLALAGAILLAMHHSGQAASPKLPPELNCTRSREARGRLCAVKRLVFSMAAVGKLPPEPPHLRRPHMTAFYVSESHVTPPDPLADSNLELISLHPMTEPQANAICSNTTRVDLPIVVLTRDTANIFHFLRTQALPLYLALAAYGLQEAPQLQLVFLDHPGHPPFASGGDRYLPDFSSLAGGVPPQTLETLPDPLCAAATTILGIDCNAIFRLDYRTPQQTKDLALPRAQLAGFIPWLLARLHISSAEPNITDAGGKRRLTLVKRTSGKRQLLNMEEVAAAAAGSGFQVEVVDLGSLTVAQQVLKVQATDVLLAVHGAALAHLAFLPPWGVSVELMPYKFGPASPDFYWGFASWARIALRSHIVWHNQDQRGASVPAGRGVEDYKSHHLALPAAELVLVLNATAALLDTPLAQRGLDMVLYLNQPVPLCSFAADRDGA